MPMTTGHKPSVYHQGTPQLITMEMALIRGGRVDHTDTDSLVSKEMKQCSPWEPVLSRKLLRLNRVFLDDSNCRNF